MYTVGIISDSDGLIENFKKSTTHSYLDYISLGSIQDVQNLDQNRDKIFSLIVLLPSSDGKIFRNEKFVEFIQKEQYHIELLVLVDLASQVKNVESYAINDKVIPVQYYNSNEQLYNSYIKKYVVVREAYEEYYELVRKCNVLTTAEFADHITRNKSLIFGKLEEIKRQDHLDIDEFLTNVFRFTRYLNVAKALGNSEWLHTEKLYGYISHTDLTEETIGNAISEITQTMDDTSLSSSKIDISKETGTNADPMILKHFGNQSFVEILKSLRGNDWRNFVIIQAFDRILDVHALLRNATLPDIYDNITNLVISLKFDSVSGFSKTKFPQTDDELSKQLNTWVGTHLDHQIVSHHAFNPVRLLADILKELEISFSSVGGFRHLVNLLAEDNRPDYYQAMNLKTETSGWVKQHAKIVNKSTKERDLTKYLDQRYLSVFLKKYPEIWVIQKPSNAETKVDPALYISSGFNEYLTKKEESSD